MQLHMRDGPAGRLGRNQIGLKRLDNWMFPTIKQARKSQPGTQQKSVKSKTPRTFCLAEAIAQLLSSCELREQFEHSPENVADQLCIAAEERRAFVGLSVEQLNRQSETLLNKRWHEVCRLAPKTIAMLNEQAEEVFRYYATNDWPIGHRRHPVDAFRFLHFLMANKLGQPDQAELKKLRRINSGL